MLIIGHVGSTRHLHAEATLNSLGQRIAKQLNDFSAMEEVAMFTCQSMIVIHPPSALEIFQAPAEVTSCSWSECDIPESMQNLGAKHNCKRIDPSAGRKR